MRIPGRSLVFASCLALGAALGGLPTLIPSSSAVASPIDQPRYASIVVDANTGEVLYARRADSPRYPASITKVMTMYLAFEALSQGRLQPNELITISPRAAAQPPSKLGLAAGQTITVDDALKALATKSANDIAVAVAEKIGGTEARFAALMTLRAQELGMTSTRFVNASGLPDSRQLSTARDIAILSRAVMRDYPQYYSYFSLRSFTFRGQTMNNHNGLLHRMPGVDGLKTGFTNASGYNLAASSVRDGRRLITVVLGGASTRSRDDHVAELLNTGFDVLRRRTSGETITVAQTIFEQRFTGTPDTPVAYASLGPTGTTGAGDASNGTVRVAMAPVENPPERAEPARPAPTPARKTEERPRRDPDAVWQIQVGAFREEQVARDWLNDVRRRFRAELRGAETAVSRGDGWYRSRFQGLTQDAARAACAKLRDKRVPCLVMRGD